MRYNLSPEYRNSPRPDPVKRTGEMIRALQDAGYSHTEIIDALLWEAGWMIDVVASGEADYLATREELCRIVSEFSDACAGLIEQPRARQGQH
jgi:hypothetical protein